MRKKKIGAIKKKKNQKIRSDQKNPVRSRWIARTKTFSNSPYVITISHYRRNIFFTAADLTGQTKFWMNSGRCGFKGRNKINNFALLILANTFFKTLRRSGIRILIFKYKNYNKNRWQFKKIVKRLNEKRRLKILGFFIETQIAFNGCRKKKKKRK